MIENNWAAFKNYFVEDHRAWKDLHPKSAGVTYPPENALVDSNNRDSEKMDAIALLDFATARDRDT